MPFAMMFGRLDDVIELVRGGLASRRWTLGDLAAIYVKIQFLAQATGPVTRIGGFDQKEFLRLVPADTVWELREQAGSKEGSRWRYDVAEPLNSSDTSWDNLVRAGLNGVRKILHVEAH